MVRHQSYLDGDSASPHCLIQLGPCPSCHMPLGGSCQLQLKSQEKDSGFCSMQRFQSSNNDSAALPVGPFSSNCPDLERKSASDVGVQPPALYWRVCLLLSSSASPSFLIPPSCCRSRGWQIKPTSIWEQSWPEACGSHQLCCTLVFRKRWRVIVGLWCLVAKSCPTLLRLHGL